MILLTGGAGYIGSHLLISLLQRGENVIVLDNLTTGRKLIFDAACQIAGAEAVFIQGDIRDAKLLKRLFARHDIDAVIHMAGLKSVSESMSNSLAYYSSNIAGTTCLLDAMRVSGVRKLIFGSSISATDCKSVYAESKLIVDNLLGRLAGNKKSRLSFASLRYSNPIGCLNPLLADNSLDNLLPEIMRIANKEKEFLSVFGGDYATPDGTAMRDYIHISDAVSATLAALDFLYENKGYYCWQVGAGSNISVKQMVAFIERQLNVEIPCILKPRREGDLGSVNCDISMTCQQLKWQPKIHFKLSD